MSVGDGRGDGYGKHHADKDLPDLCTTAYTESKRSSSSWSKPQKILSDSSYYSIEDALETGLNPGIFLEIQFCSTGFDKGWNSWPRTVLNLRDACDQNISHQGCWPEPVSGWIHKSQAGSETDFYWGICNYLWGMYMCMRVCDHTWTSTNKGRFLRKFDS